MESPKKMIQYVPDPNKFDLVTHRWDTQGNLVAKNLYRSFIVDGTQYFERPVNSGNLWYENNQPAGRVEYKFGPSGKISSKKIEVGAPHKEWTAPLTGDEKLHYELQQERDKRAAAEAELLAIKAERVTVKEAPAAKKAGG